MKKTFFSISLLFIAICSAMEDEPFLTPYNSINGQPITNANIGTLALQLPLDIQDLAVDWIFDNGSSILAITDIPDPLNYGALLESQKAARSTCLLCGNQSKSNLTCTLDNDHKIKMAGTLNKVRSLLLSAQKENSYRWDAWNKADYKAVKTIDPTHQTISYAGHYHLLTKAIKEHNLDKIKTPDMYFVHIPGKTYEYVDDNYAIVQHTVKDTVNLATLKDTEQKELISSFDEAMLDQQHKATRLAILWNIANNMLINPKNPTTIHITDLEQPNNSKSHLFFYQGKQGDWKRWWDAKTGLEDMQKLYNEHGSTHQQNQWRQLTEQWALQEENIPYR